MKIDPKYAGGVVALALAIATPFIAEWEGKRNGVYFDAVGVPTICYGHTGPEVKKGLWYNDEQCKAILRADIEKHVAPVLRCAPVLKDHPWPLAASASLAFNIGPGAFCRSSAAAAFNRGDFAHACDRFLVWNRAGGRELPGLTRRRIAERDLCRRGLPHA